MTREYEQSLVLELLAKFAHDQWANWTLYMLTHLETEQDGEPNAQRWARQAVTSYAALSEPEKESDRNEARKLFALLRTYNLCIITEETLAALVVTDTDIPLIAEQN